MEHNCHLSDARHAGDLGLCTYLLRLREHYRWEHELPFDAPLPGDAVGRWIEQREGLWASMEHEDFQPLPLTTGPADPFDAERVNAELGPLGYVYTAGIGRFGKPHFSIGLLERTEFQSGYSVLTSSCEYVRDLEPVPAVLQGNTIFLRTEAIRALVHQKIVESGWNPKAHPAILRALESSGWHDDAGAAMERLVADQRSIMLWHELGEAEAARLIGPAWAERLSACTRSSTEVALRALRDDLADCLVTLPALIEARAMGPLNWWYGSLSGLRQKYLPEAALAWQELDDERLLAALRRHVIPARQRLLQRIQEVVIGGAVIEDA